MPKELRRLSAKLMASRSGQPLDQSDRRRMKYPGGACCPGRPGNRGLACRRERDLNPRDPSGFGGTWRGVVGNGPQTVRSRLPARTKRWNWPLSWTSFSQDQGNAPTAGAKGGVGLLASSSEVGKRKFRLASMICLLSFQTDSAQRSFGSGFDAGRPLLYWPTARMQADA